MIKEKLTAIVFEALSRSLAAGQIGLPSSELQSLPIHIDRSRGCEHGDLSCPVAMHLAAQTVPPVNALQLAEILVSQIKSSSENSGYFSRVEAEAPGFINFGLGPRLGAEILVEIGRLAENYGRISSNSGASILFEYCLPEGPQEHSLNESEGAIAIDRDAAGLTSRSNRTFLLQHAFAWSCSMLRLATEPPVNILTSQLEAPLMSVEQWEAFLFDCKIKVEMYLHLDLFRNDQDGLSTHLRQSQTALILKLGSFPEEVAGAAQNSQPERLARFALDLANDLTNFPSRFNLGEGLFCADLSVLKARLGLILATRQVLINALGIIGMPTPEQM